MTDAGTMPHGTVSIGTYVPTGSDGMSEGAPVSSRSDEYEAREEALDELMRRNLREELKRLRLKPYALARLAGVSPSTITRFLAGGRGIGKMTLFRLVNSGAGFSIDRLMSGKLGAGPPSPETPRRPGGQPTAGDGHRKSQPHG